MTNPFGPERIHPGITHGASDMDNQANDFACAILMPEAAFRTLYAEHKGSIIAISRAFQLPTAAVWRRAAMLGLNTDPTDEAHTYFET